MGMRSELTDSARKMRKLPTEAELRLLKHIQEAVAEGTKDQDAQKDKDKEELLTLSTRQNDLRDLFDRLIQKATGGQQKLGPRPDPNDQLPEEATKEDVDKKELVDTLIDDKDPDKAVSGGEKLTGDRMARSADRLAKDDAGKVTQEIQRKSPRVDRSAIQGSSSGA